MKGALLLYTMNDQQRRERGDWQDYYTNMAKYSSAWKDGQKGDIMSEVWNKVYKSDNAFFGQDASNFALLCLNHMKMNNVRRYPCSYGAQRRTYGLVIMVIHFNIKCIRLIFKPLFEFTI